MFVQSPYNCGRAKPAAERDRASPSLQVNAQPEDQFGVTQTSAIKVVTPEVRLSEESHSRQEWSALQANAASIGHAGGGISDAVPGPRIWGSRLYDHAARVNNSQKAPDRHRYHRKKCPGYFQKTGASPYPLIGALQCPISQWRVTDVRGATEEADAKHRCGVVTHLEAENKVILVTSCVVLYRPRRCSKIELRRREVRM